MILNAPKGLQKKRDEITDYAIQRMIEIATDDYSKFIEMEDVELHFYIFRPDYLLGRWECTRWLGEDVFNVIDHIQEWEDENFEKRTCDCSNPEDIVNLYSSLIGKEILPMAVKYILSLREDGEI